MSIGLGIEEPFGQNDDVVGLAMSWQDPSDRSRRDQYVLETFYRFYVVPRTHLTPGIEVIVDPAHARTKNAVAIFGLRLRTLY